MTRETSHAAYEAILEEGILGRQQWLILKMLIAHGPMTANECIDRLLRWLVANGQPRVSEQIHTRFSELRDKGAIQEVGTRACKITGRDNIVWAPTGRAPTKRKRAHRFVCPTCQRPMRSALPSLPPPTKEGK